MKYGQLQTVLSVHLDKWCAYLSIKKHKSYSVIQHATLVGSLVVVFIWLDYEVDICDSFLLNQAVSKVITKLKDLWWFQTVKRNLDAQLSRTSIHGSKKRMKHTFECSGRRKDWCRIHSQLRNSRRLPKSVLQPLKPEKEPFFAYKGKRSR